MVAFGLALLLPAGCGGDEAPPPPPPPPGLDDADAAPVEPDQPGTDTDTADDAGDDQPGQPDPGGAELDEPAMPIDGRHRLHLEDRLVEIELRDGAGVLPDGRRVELDRRLTVTGDVTGDGVDETIIAGQVLPATGDRPAVPVLSLRAGDEPLDPPQVDLPALIDLHAGVVWGREPANDARIVALGVQEAGIEARVAVEAPDDVATPLGPTRRYEQRWQGGPGRWEGSNDGPVTRAARTAIASSDVPWGAGDTLVCGQPPGPRGTTIACHELASDGPGQVALLFVDDDLGYRIEVARDQLLTGEQIARELGNEARCADIRELSETGFLTPVVPFAAISYWFQQGQPARMDASGEGRPCATVWPEAVELLHGGVDGRIVETYQSLVF